MDRVEREELLESTLIAELDETIATRELLASGKPLELVALIALERILVREEILSDVDSLLTADGAEPLEPEEPPQAGRVKYIKTINEIRILLLKEEFTIFFVSPATLKIYYKQQYVKLQLLPVKFIQSTH